MKVYFDARWILVENRFDGVSRYSHKLAWALSEQPDLDIVWLVHDIRQLDKLPDREHLLVNDPNNAIAELRLPSILNKAGATAVYSPFFIMGTLGKKYKLILTIHDLIYFTHKTPPQWLRWYVRLGWRLFHLTYWPLRWQLNRADQIATVSHTARQELLDARATVRPITTVSNAADQTFDVPARDHSTSNNVIYMGAFTPYKNVECLIDAIALVPDATLHLLGKLPDSRRPAIEARITNAGVSDRVVIHNGVSDDTYISLLADARCAISASRSEGFGLPLIEAQRAGVPFIASDTPIFHEIGGDSVLYFDPDNPAEAAAHIQSLGDTTASQSLVTAGHDNVTRFSWQTSAATATEIIRSLI